MMGLVDEVENSFGDYVGADGFNWMNHPLGNNRSMAAASGINAVIPNTSQVAILYNGGFCLYDGIPAEKLHEIMRIASAAAKSIELKKNGTQTPIPTIPSSPQGSTSNLASLQPLPAHNSSICRLQAEFPLARRQSLQRFLEKRRFRLGSRAPYLTPSTTKVAENAFDLAFFRGPEEQFQPSMAAS